MSEQRGWSPEKKDNSFVDAVSSTVKGEFEAAKKANDRQRLLGVASQAANIIEILVGKTDAEMPDRGERIEEMKTIVDYWEEWRVKNPEK